MNKIRIMKKMGRPLGKENGLPVGTPNATRKFLNSFGSKTTLNSRSPLKIPGLEKGMVEEMTSLYYAINALLSGTSSRIIQFIGSNEGEGTTTITRRLARVASEKFGKSVRIVDTESQKSGELLYYDFEFENRVTTDSSRDAGRFGPNGSQQFKPRLFVKSYSKRIGLNDHDPDLLGNSDILENMRNKLDYIFVDSIAVNISSGDLAISHKVDGVILIVEAEKTRWKVIESVKEKIIKHGGNIIGVVFNKQKHYIPEIIYKNL